jgi:formylglycine-generating enzyme required for sulfatase activity
LGELAVCNGNSDCHRRQTVLDRVLDFWLEAYREEARNRAESGADTWQDSPAERHLRMEQALVGLWRNPTESIPELYRLYRGSLADSIKQQMAALAPKDRHLGKADQIRLPWLWSDRSGPEKQMLFAMNFAEASTGKVELRQPGRLWLGFGLGIAMGLAALLFTLVKPWEMPAGKPVLQHDAFKPEAPAEFFQPLGGGRWRVGVATPDWRVETEAPEGATVTAAWPEAIHSCRENGPGGELWHGACAHPAHRQPEPMAHSFAALDAAADVAAPLVLSLLQSGSADLVLTAPANPSGLQDHWLSYVDVDPEHTQLLMIGPNLTVNAIESAAEVGRNKPAPAGVSGKLADRMPETVAGRPYSGLQPNLNSTALNPSLPHRVWLQASDWQSLANALNFTGERSVAQVWPNAVAIAGDPKQARLLGVCQPQADPAITGMSFVRLCPGRFLMGSPDSEKDREKDESPQHWVSLSAFDLGQTEVTNAQYQRFKPDHPDKDDRPVAKVNWNEAKAFCEHYGYRLPTEAEWEYAARAGSPGRWPFGEDETQLNDYVWYSENAGDKTHPVGQKQPNPWGLHDMAGNVWEWVADWYGDYKEAAQIDPTGPAAGNGRVLRGGAFDIEPRYLRSAFRARFSPEYRNQFFGFRCARGPRRPE